MSTTSGGIDPHEEGASDSSGPVRRELSRRQLLAKAGAVGGLGVLMPSLASVGLPAAGVEASPQTSAAGVQHQLYLGPFSPGTAPYAVFSALMPASHGLDVIFRFTGSGPTDQQATTTGGHLDATVILLRPLGDMSMWNLISQIHQGNYQKVVTNMDLVSLDDNGNTLSQLRLYNAWVSSVDVYGNETDGWFEVVNLTCDDFRLVPS